MAATDGISSPECRRQGRQGNFSHEALWTAPLCRTAGGRLGAMLTPEVFSFLLGRERPGPWVSFRFAYFVHRIHGKQHEVIETVAAVVVMLAQFEINFRTLGQPKFHILFGKCYRCVFGDLMLSQKLNFWHRVHQLGFNADDLKLVGGYPG